MTLSYHKFDDRESLLDALQRDLLTTLSESISLRGKAAVALSGGNTPKPLYEALANKPLDWSSVSVTLSDERHVALDSPSSNEAMIKRSLLQHEAAEATFVSFVGDDFSAAHAPQDTASAASERLAAGFPTGFDVVLLGMGNDMHTASLFPDAPELTQALSTQSACVALHPQSAGEPRLSLSLPWLLNTRRIVLLITGHDKWAALEQAMSHHDPLNAPVSAITDQTDIPVSVYWCP